MVKELIFKIIHKNGKKSPFPVKVECTNFPEGGEVTKEAIAEAGGLTTPEEAPEAEELVGVGTDGAQTSVGVGDGLEIENGKLKSLTTLTTNLTSGTIKDLFEELKEKNLLGKLIFDKSGYSIFVSEVFTDNIVVSIVNLRNLHLYGVVSPTDYTTLTNAISSYDISPWNEQSN